MSDARDILDWMAKSEEEGGGGKRAEWIDGASKSVAWIWWKRPEEWAGLIADWVCILLFRIISSFEMLEGSWG